MPNPENCAHVRAGRLATALARLGDGEPHMHELDYSVDLLAAWLVKAG